MANLPVPEEHIVFELAEIRRKFLKKSLEDNQIDPAERRGLTRIDNLIVFTGDVKARRQLASHIEKGGNPTDYMNRLAEPIGMKVVSIEESRNVVPFPANDSSA